MAAFGGALLLFGGDNGALLSDTWTWSGTAWTQLQVTGPTLAGGAMAAVDGALVMFGGYDEENSAVAPTWTWGGTSWIELAGPSPPPRYGAAMATPEVLVLPP
jgi:hypothetical protein